MHHCEESRNVRETLNIDGQRGEASLNHPAINAASISSSGRSGSPGKKTAGAAIKFICQLFDECSFQLCLGGLLCKRGTLRFTISSHTFVSDLLITSFRRNTRACVCVCGRAVNKKREILYRTIILERGHAAGDSL